MASQVLCDGQGQPLFIWGAVNWHTRWEATVNGQIVLTSQPKCTCKSPRHTPCTRTDGWILVGPTKCVVTFTDAATKAPMTLVMKGNFRHTKAKVMHNKTVIATMHRERKNLIFYSVSPSAPFPVSPSRR
jgi:hypothetical protein